MADEKTVSSQSSDTGIITAEQSEYERNLKEASRKGNAEDFLGEYAALQGIRSDGSRGMPDDFMDEWARLYVKFPRRPDRWLGSQAV